MHVQYIYIYGVGSKSLTQKLILGILNITHVGVFQRYSSHVSHEPYLYQNEDFKALRRVKMPITKLDAFRTGKAVYIGDLGDQG